ncbi:NUDIX hydrolase domain-like protein [Triangularia setosa]|uniref:NUDIX hydrolase domain-like protein n=1 Tax=Triangularia setosa TaxID=2587417 RepID=A0AAN7AA99_9PEZI|nr:NUDIX hydrolase domain-like protein [Podospora setosa]
MEEYNHPLSTYLPNHPSITGGLVVSAVIIHTTSLMNDVAAPPHSLIIQRTLKDGFPLKWETPGGGVEDSDASIISAAVREVKEETGLAVDVEREFLGTVGGLGEWVEPRTGLLWRKVTFLVRIEGEEGGLPEVRLEEREHRDFRWVRAEEVEEVEGEEGGIEFAYGELRRAILEGFGRVRELDQEKRGLGS